MARIREPARCLTRACFIAGSLLLAFTVGCSPHAAKQTGKASSAAPGPWFGEFSNALNLHFIHEAQASGQYLFSESIGSGGALLDFDNDGRLDVYLIHNVDPSSVTARNRLFHQLSDGTFQDVSAGSGLDLPGYGNGLAVGDVNNDGFPEILVTEFDRIRLFLNRGNGRFEDITIKAGLTNQHWSVPAAFVDYDRDGWLDLVIGNYLDFDPTQRCPDARGEPDFCGPHGFRPTITRLFRNLGGSAGGDPRFSDVTLSSGLARAPGKAMQIVCADFDGDHWPDLFITDDGLPNRLFINQRNGSFTEEAVARGVAYTGMGAALANMGIALADVDGDGLFDLFVPHLAEEPHTLWRQGPRGLFQDETARFGLLGLPWHSTGFGAVLADFDGDGAPDLAIANGLVRRAPGRATSPGASLASFWTPYAVPSQILANDGTGRFRDVSAAHPAFCGEARVGRGLICGDIDNDGRLDLLAIGLGGPVQFCRNIAPVRGHWLGVRAIDPALGGRDAYGAELVLTAGSRRWWRQVQPAYSYASSNDPRVHFGLGALTTIDSLQVRWPDGVEEIFYELGMDRYTTVRRGTGSAVKR